MAVSRSSEVRRASCWPRPLVGNGIAAVAHSRQFPVARQMGDQAIRAIRGILDHADSDPGGHPALLGGWLGSPALAQSLGLARHDAGQRGSVLVLRIAVATAAWAARYRAAANSCDPPVRFQDNDHRCSCCAGSARSLLRLLRIQRASGGLHRLLRDLPHCAWIRPRGGRGFVFHGHRHSNSVPYPVGLGRQLLCGATDRDVVGWRLEWRQVSW